MTTPSPDDLFKIDKEMFQRFRKDPEALGQYFEQLVQAVARPVRAAVHATRVEPKFPPVVPAPNMAVDSLFPISVEPKVPEAPVKKAASPVTPVVATPEPSIRPRPMASSPKAPTPLVDNRVDSRPTTVRQVDYAVPQALPKVSPVVADLPKEISKKSGVASSVPVASPVDDVPNPAPSDGVQSKDMAAAEKRRKEREEMLSSVMRKDQGNVL